MSLLRRKRRQNRNYAIEFPATRNARSFLVPRERGLRKPLANTLLRLRNIEPKSNVETIQPAERLRLNTRKQRLRSVNRANQLVADTHKTGLISIGDYGKIQVDLPSNHPVCVKRRERREIIFAKNKAGKGGQKKPKKPELTIRCE